MIYLRVVDEPLYRRLARKIEERIVTGAYRRGATLPAESALEHEFGVSRVTVRQALGLLKHRGLLYSRSGLGTVVRSDGPDPSSMRMTGSLTDLINYGAETDYELLDRRLIADPPAITEPFGLAPRAPVVRFRGLRSRPGAARFALEEIWLPADLGRLLGDVRPGKRALFSLLEEAAHLRISEAYQTITAAPAPPLVSRHLGLRPRSPVLRVTRQYALADGRVVEIAISHYNPSEFQYSMTLYRE
jgi:DNA-binding GntR family transcriptional regulator